MNNSEIELGSKVRDPITGFTGIAVARVRYLAGCARVAIQPEWKKGEQRTPDMEYFDEPLLEVLSPPTKKMRERLGFQGIG